MSIMRLWEGLRGCLRGMWASERAIVGVAGVFLAGSIVSGIVLGMIVSWLAQQTPDRAQYNTPTVGTQVASGLLSAYQARRTSEQTSTGPLTGALVFVQAPDEQTAVQARGLVVFSGGQVVSSPEAAHLKMSWDESEQHWQVSSLKSQAPELALIGWFVLRRASPEFHYAQGQSGLSNPKMSTFFVGSAPRTQQDRLVFARSMVAGLVLFSTLFPALGLIVFAAGILSFEIERERATGALECFSMASRPIWLMFLARAVARTTLPLACAIIMLSIACLFIGFPSPIVLLCVMLCLWCISLVLNLIGQIQVVWFHHRLSRLMGMIVFNPLISGGVLLFGLMPQLLSRFSTQLQQAATQSAALPLIGWSAPQALMITVIVVPVSAVLVVVLCCAMEWRLGVRRQGLARLD